MTIAYVSCCTRLLIKLACSKLLFLFLCKCVILQRFFHIFIKLKPAFFFFLAHSIAHHVTEHNGVTACSCIIIVCINSYKSFLQLLFILSIILISCQEVKQFVYSKLSAKWWHFYNFCKISFCNSVFLHYFIDLFCSGVHTALFYVIAVIFFTIKHAYIFAFALAVKHTRKA